MNPFTSHCMNVSLLCTIMHCLSQCLFIVDFFEECIKEEKYEADKLDILRVAMGAKTSYTTETGKVENKPVSVPSEEEVSNQQAAAASSSQEIKPISNNLVTNGNGGFEEFDKLEKI